MQEFILVLTVVELAVLFVALVFFVVFSRQGDAKFNFMVEQRTPFVLESMDNNSAVFTSSVPFINCGTQDGTLTDVYPRHQLPFEYYDGVEIAPRLTLESMPRKDGYWEAMIIFKKTGGVILLTVKLTAKDGEISSALNNMVDMPIDIVYQAVSRSDWYIDKTTLVMTAEEIRSAVKQNSAYRQGAM